MSPHRQLVEAFVAANVDEIRGGNCPPRPWLDLGGGRRGRRPADVCLDLAGACDIRGDAQKLPVRDGAFALVTAIEMLYFVADLEQALWEIHRVLKPGGRLVLTCPFSHPTTEAGDWRRPTAHAWLWMLRHAGLHMERIQPLGGSWSMIWQALYITAQGGRHANDVSGHVREMRGGSLAVSAGGSAHRLRLRPVPLPEPPAVRPAQSGRETAIRVPPGQQNAARRSLASLVARTAPLARRLDARYGAAWPLGHGVVARKA